MSVSPDHQAGIMVAPNGARLTQQDHPDIPVTAAQLVYAVAQATEKGARAVHIHVRDSQQRHILDTDLYLDSIAAVKRSQGADFPIQITTEAVGCYMQHEQIKIVQEVRPEFASVALAEMAGEETQLVEASDFYHWCYSEHVGIQHILYSVEDLQRFTDLKTRGVIPADMNSVLFVLGRYAVGQLSDTSMLDAFLSVMKEQLVWMICAFGQTETQCLAYATENGGHVRVGFENNILHEDGSVAASNAERVNAIKERILLSTGVVDTYAQMYRILGRL